MFQIIATVDSITASAPISSIERSSSQAPIGAQISTAMTSKPTAWTMRSAKDFWVACSFMTSPEGVFR
ncbi:hypothetical protein D3C79_824720 [compost metagenome]